MNKRKVKAVVMTCSRQPTFGTLLAFERLERKSHNAKSRREKHKFAHAFPLLEVLVRPSSGQHRAQISYRFSRRQAQACVSLKLVTALSYTKLRILWMAIRCLGTALALLLEMLLL